LSSAPYGERRSPSSRFLPPDPKVQEPYRLTPGLALRVAVLGALALIAFGILFLRLWSLQVLSGETYLDVAQNNQLRTIRVEAPRGYVLDRNGRVIVGNTPGTAVKLWVGDLPKRGRYALIQRLAGVLGVPPGRLAREVDERADEPANPITVKTDVTEPQIRYLYEHQSEFPGVQVQDTYLRYYPHSTLAAHVLGYVGEISEGELKQNARRYRLGDRVGKTGVERTYDLELRGAPGLAQVRVDSMGRPQSSPEIRREPRAGHALRLTLDLGLQRAAERAIRDGIKLAHENDSWFADGGAIVAIDPRDGAVLAMASNPTYKPSVYVEPVDRKKIARLLDDEAADKANHPALNRATYGQYPPGSTWKPVVALAAMQEHLLAPGDAIQCTPSATYGRDNQVFRNWNPYVNEPMNLESALAESCDTYFYDIGNRFYYTDRDRMQQWAQRLGFGSVTGFDIGGEAEGLVPTPEWRKKTFTSDWDRAWNPGDSIQLAIGQKDVTVTPLQLARFYAMLANGGKLVTPYLVSAVEQPGVQGEENTTLRRFPADPPQPAGIDPAALEPVRRGLYAATHAVDGTSSGVFATYPVPIAGKTGTAEKVVPLPGYPADHLEDQSWWCGWGPYDGSSFNGKSPIVVCALIENGGHGSTAAAPAALQVFEEWFGEKAASQVLVATD
jgi:penicillin-binding protein 2